MVANNAVGDVFIIIHNLYLTVRIEISVNVEIYLYNITQARTNPPRNRLSDKTIAAGLQPISSKPLKEVFMPKAAMAITKQY